MENKYKSQAAKDAQRLNYGNADYWKYLDEAIIEQSEYYKSVGNEIAASFVLTRSLSEALRGNDGD